MPDRPQGEAARRRVGPTAHARPRPGPYPAPIVSGPAHRHVGPPPLVGLTTSEMRMPDGVRPILHGEPPHREMALGMRYVQAVARAGGAPVVMPPVPDEALETLLERLSALCLPGGPDLQPAAYGEEPHPLLGPTEPEVDAFELELIRRADERGLPILAICRGAQALNVARGGSLHQHLPDVVGETVRHRQAAPEWEATHDVEIAAGSRLARTMGGRAARVNSFHHQAVKALGRGLRPVAWSSDGAVEGIEDPDHPFLVGVQWHAEGLVGAPEHDRLFDALVSAARRRDVTPASRVA